MSEESHEMHADGTAAKEGLQAPNDAEEARDSKYTSDNEGRSDPPSPRGKSVQKSHEAANVYDSKSESEGKRRNTNPIRKFDSIEEDTLALLADMGLRPSVTEYDEDVNALLDDINEVDQDVNALLDDIGMKNGESKGV